MWTRNPNKIEDLRVVFPNMGRILANSGEIEEIITVVGSRTERSLDQVAATVSVIDAAQIEENYDGGHQSSCVS